MSIQARRGLLTGRSAYDPAAGGGLGLQTNLTAFWSLENTSWLDDTGNGTTLTGNGSPSASAGLVGNAVNLNGSTQWLSATSNTNIITGNSSFSAQCWVNLSVNGGDTKYIFNKTDNAFAGTEFGFGTNFTTSNVWCCEIGNTGGNLFRVDATASGAGLYASSVWRHLVLTYDNSGKTLTFYVNGASTGTPATLTGTMNSTTNSLQIGRLAATTPFATGLIDQCGFWKGRVLSAGDVTNLYNSGSGLSYAAMA